MITLVPVLMEIFAPFYLMKRIIQWYYIRQISRGECYQTQKFINTVMEKPGYRMKENLSMIMKTMFFAATFTVVIPYGSPLVAIGLFFYYHASKVKHKLRNNC